MQQEEDDTCQEGRRLQLKKKEYHALIEFVAVVHKEKSNWMLLQP